MSQVTIFDEQIADLEGQKVRLEGEFTQLRQGQVQTTLPGGQLFTVNLNNLTPSTLNQYLTNQNPLVAKLVEGGKKKQELKKELGLEIPAPSSQSGLFGLHSRINLWVKTKNKLVGAVLGSRWLILVGIVILIIWVGPSVLYNLSSGTMGGSTPPRPKAAPVKTITLTPLPYLTPTPDSQKVALFNYAGDVSDDPEATPTPEPTQGITPSNSGVTSTSNPQTSTPGLNYKGRVGQAPSDTGGLNGSHGAFLAPSRLTITALKLNANIERVLTTDTEAGGVEIIWPTGNEVGHFGAYPGEVGNLLFFGTQESLGILRRIQQNDLISVYDRNGNIFRYRMLAFSPTGQPERVVDLANPTDAFLLQPTSQSILTILVNLPRESFLVENKASSEFGAVTPPTQDDYLTTKRLAYRAVLVNYAPATVTPSGIPVGVPKSVWQTSPAVPYSDNLSTQPGLTGSTSTTIEPTRSVTPNPNQGNSYPGLPNTGDGWCSSHQCERR